MAAQVVTTHERFAAEDRRELDDYFDALEAGGLRVSLVIPTLDEEENLRQLLPSLPRSCEIVVVDGQSRDATLDAVRSARPDAVIITQRDRGKGDALLRGFEASSGDLIVTFDADGSADPAELPIFVQALLDGAGFAKGSRMLPGGGSSDLTFVRRMGNRVLSICFNILYRTRYTDLCYGFNAFWRGCLAYMPARAAGFEIETQLHAWMATSPVDVVEVPSFERQRAFGDSRLRPIRDGLRIVSAILRSKRLRRDSVLGADPGTPYEVARPSPLSPTGIGELPGSRISAYSGPGCRLSP
jgi:glycosyltransferase involved in cell wall biosynthesis